MPLTEKSLDQTPPMPADDALSMDGPNRPCKGRLFLDPGLRTLLSLRCGPVTAGLPLTFQPGGGKAPSKPWSRKSLRRRGAINSKPRRPGAPTPHHIPTSLRIGPSAAGTPDQDIGPPRDGTAKTQPPA